MNELPFVYISTFFLSLASRSHLRQEPTVALRHSEKTGRSLLERGSLGSPFMQTARVGGLSPHDAKCVWSNFLPCPLHALLPVWKELALTLGGGQTLPSNRRVYYI